MSHTHIPDNAIDTDFWKRFMPTAQIKAIANAFGDPASSYYGHSIEQMYTLRPQILDMPGYWDIAEDEAKDIRVILHYRMAESDWYLSTLGRYKKSRQEDFSNGDYALSFGFARLSNNFHFAELGSVPIYELLTTPFMTLDLDWDINTTLQDVIDKNKEGIRA